MNKLIEEALKLAEEALVMYCEHGAIFKPNEALAAIREALAEPVEQEPMAWLIPEKYCVTMSAEWAAQYPDDCEPLYREPVDAKAIRAEALEEAADWVEKLGALNTATPENLAAAIRGLK